VQGKKRKKTDPELLRQIDSVGASNDSIQAVFSLDLPLKKMLDPNIVEETTHKVLRRAEEELGHKPKDVSVFKNLGSFAVSADASFIRRIIDDPDIASAVASNQPDPDVEPRSKS
jgi:hypothetical protein